MIKKAHKTIKEYYGKRYVNSQTTGLHISAKLSEKYYIISNVYGSHYLIKHQMQEGDTVLEVFTGTLEDAKKKAKEMIK